MAKPILIKAVKIAEKGKALDLGAGTGFDSLFLACKGYKVTAVEKAEELTKEIEMMEIPNIKVVNRNIKEFGFKEEYNLINCSFVLHFLGKDAKIILSKIQGSTTKRGINVIAAFLNKGDFYNTNEGYFSLGELKEIYNDWKAVTYLEKLVPTKERNADGSIKNNSQCLQSSRRVSVVSRLKRVNPLLILNIRHKTRNKATNAASYS